MSAKLSCGFRYIVAIATITALTAPAMASVVSDLEGSRAAGALEDMDRRGFVQTSAYSADGGSYTYWWNPQSKACVRLLTREGRIAATKTTTAADCGQKASSGGGDAAAAAIAGAAIIAGIAALSHKSHHRDDQEWNDTQSYAEFERGHRDGLYSQSFQDYNNSAKYRDGFNSGVSERGHKSSYRSGGYYDKGSGYAAPVYYQDLVGARAAGALSDLETRGFRSVDSFQSGNDGAGTVWWNKRTRQCVQAITVDGHIYSLNDAQSHPRCR